MSECRNIFVHTIEWWRKGVWGQKRRERDEGESGGLESERNSISPGLSAFNPCHILTCWRSINLPVSPARKVSAHTHCVCLSVFAWFHARTMAAQKGQFIAQTVSACIVSLCARVCLFISKVISHRRIGTVATCDLAMMTYSCTDAQPGLQARIYITLVVKTPATHH